MDVKNLATKILIFTNCFVILFKENYSLMLGLPELWVLKTPIDPNLIEALLEMI